MKAIMSSLLHQNLLNHLLMVWLPLRSGFRVSHVDIVTGIETLVNVYNCYDYGGHLSNWSLVMNCSNEQCSIHERKFASQISHMNFICIGCVCPGVIKDIKIIITELIIIISLMIVPFTVCSSCWWSTDRLTVPAPVYQQHQPVPTEGPRH